MYIHFGLKKYKYLRTAKETIHLDTFGIYNKIIINVVKYYLYYYYYYYGNLNISGVYDLKQTKIIKHI